jgi:hypothetical protein
MWWNDLKDIKAALVVLEERFSFVERTMLNISLNINPESMEKLADYSQNIDRLNSMINEFKGCVAMSRAALEEGKQSKKIKKGTQVS